MARKAKKKTKKKASSKKKSSKKKTSKKKTSKKTTKKTSKKTTKKKAKKKTESASDHMDETFGDLDQDLADFDFDEPADIPPPRDHRAEIPPGAKTTKRPSMIGLKVSLVADTGGTIVGTVTERNGDMLVVQGPEDQWDVQVKEVQIVEKKDDDAGEEPEDAGEEEQDDAGGSEPEGADGEKDDDDIGLDDLELGPDESGGQEQVRTPEEPREEPPEPETDEERKASPRAAGSVREVKLLPVSKIKVPSVQVRKVDKDSKKYKVMRADIKRRGLSLPIEVISFAKPTLINGGYRVEIYKELGIKEIPCFENTEVRDQDDRLYHSLLANEMTEPMHWVDMAKTFSRLRQGEYTGVRLARAFGISETQVSKMIKAVTLDEEILATAKLPVGEGGYSRTVYIELGTAPDEVKAKIKSDMKANRPITQYDVRMLNKEHAKKNRDSGGSGTGGSTSTPPAVTRRTLSVDDTGKAVKIVVKRHEVEVTLRIPWDRKSFKGFSLGKQMTGLVDEAMFAAPAEEAAVGSDSALRKKLNEALAEISA